jgi:hypothetical protein
MQSEQASEQGKSKVDFGFREFRHGRRGKRVVSAASTRRLPNGGVERRFATGPGGK